MPRATTRPWELIVVDNASGDGSPRWLARHQPQVRLLLNRENLGFARACRQAAAQARPGWHLLFLNSDAWPEPGALDLLAAALEADAGLALVGPSLLGEDGAPQASAGPAPPPGSLWWRLLLGRLDRARRSAYRSYRRAALPRAAQDVDRLGGAALLARRSAWEACPLDPGFVFGFEDLDWCCRLRAEGWRLRFVPEARVRHAGGVASARQRPFVRVGFERGALRYLARHEGLTPARRYALAVLADQPLRLAQGLAAALLSACRGRRQSTARHLAEAGLALALLARPLALLGETLSPPPEVLPLR